MLAGWQARRDRPPTARRHEFSSTSTGVHSCWLTEGGWLSLLGERHGDPIGLFRSATGFDPYDYQRLLLTRPQPPEVIEVPTGAGKTFAVLVPWLADPRAPRRLVYALPMRSLVEQTAATVSSALQRVGLADEIAVHVLMGGEQAGDWRRDPERRMVLVGTIDMLLSRALNRGYGESRFAWPVAFALLNNDCRWIFDEVQLMGAARTTSAQLAGLRAKLGTLLPCETVWMSATVERASLRTVDHTPSGDVVGLSDADRQGPLARRLEAVKDLSRVDLVGADDRELPRRLAQLAAEHHRPGTRTLVIVNRVKTAQDTYRALAKLTGNGPRAILVHSRYRPDDRAAHMAEALAEPSETGTIVVATQVVEAGIDMSSACLLTETAPFSSMVQRLGRCNRAGEHDRAEVVWVDRGELSEASAAPYDPLELARAAETFAGLVGSSVSPSRLETLKVAEPPGYGAVLRRSDLLDLFDTAPDLSGADIDVAGFIREDDDRSIEVFFRDLDDETRGSVDEPKPRREEIVTVPIGELAKRRWWRFDHVDGGWRRAQDGQRPVPGSVVMLGRADGGYSAEYGWTGDRKDQPQPLEASAEEPESFGSDTESLAQADWVSLEDHLAATAEQGRRLTAGLADDLADAVQRAAALHDIGKAHHEFQTMLLGTIDDEAERSQRASVGLWAKSAERGRGRHSRRYFRHELASALALRDREPPLIRYLVAAHHGRVRMSIRPAPGEEHPQGRQTTARFALGVCDGDALPEVKTPVGVLQACELDLAEMELGGGWSAAALGLLEELGPFRLAYLEALVRVADWRASG